MKTIFIDLNKKLVSKVRKAVKYLPEEFNVSVKCGDIFKEDGVIVSASNSSFTMGGGLDALIVKHYPEESKLIQKKKKQQQIGEVMFVVTVGKDLKATRETVGNALRFALDEHNHMATDQTMLVSGLGTGVGGLDEDDFVWLFLSVVIETNKNYGWGIKYTKTNGKDWKTGTKQYLAGKWISQKNTSETNEDCGVGLHLGKSFVGAGNYNFPEKIFFCLYKNENLYGNGDDKVRVSKLLPLYVCPQWLGYGINGKKIVGKINKKINLERYNPYQTEKMPEKKLLKKLWAQVWDQVRDQVWAQVRDQVGAQVWAQVGGQVRATSYWAMNIYFSLGIIHPFFDFLKLGVMVVFLKGKVKVFGKKGKFLGEFDESELK